MMITSHFSIDEFQSHDGAEMPDDVFLNVVQLAVALEVLRSSLNSPIVVNSGYRSPQHNANVGGVANSQHIYGKAADITSTGYTPEQIVEKINYLKSINLLPSGGLGLYDNFVHFDIRGTDAYWDYRKKKDETTESSGKKFSNKTLVISALGGLTLLCLFRFI